MQLVKFAIIDKRTADFKVRTDSSFMSEEVLWGYFRKDESVISKADFMKAAKVIMGVPVDAPAAIFTYVDELVDPETGEVFENHNYSYDDFMADVYKRRTELIAEHEAQCQYRVIFSLLDFLQNM